MGHFADKNAAVRHPDLFGEKLEKVPATKPPGSRLGSSSKTSKFEKRGYPSGLPFQPKDTNRSFPGMIGQVFAEIRMPPSEA